MTNRKSHTRFRLVPKSTTLDELERPLRTLFQNTCVFGANDENLNDDRPTVSAAKMSLVSGNIGFMGIFAGVPVGVKRQWVYQKRRFSGLSDEVLRSYANYSCN